MSEETWQEPQTELDVEQQVRLALTAALIEKGATFNLAENVIYLSQLVLRGTVPEPPEDTPHIAEKSISEQ